MKKQAVEVSYDEMKKQHGDKLLSVVTGMLLGEIRALNLSKGREFSLRDREVLSSNLQCIHELLVGLRDESPQGAAVPDKDALGEMVRSQEGKDEEADANDIYASFVKNLVKMADEFDGTGDDNFANRVDSMVKNLCK